MSLVTSLQLILPPRPRGATTKFLCSLKNPTQQIQELSSSSSSSSPISFLPNLISFALALSLTSSSSPALAIPSLSSSQPLTTPFTQSKFVQTGLLNGKIRPCPSTNPGCVSTNPTSSSFSFPLPIPETDKQQDPIQKLKDAIVSTQKNPKFMVLEDTPYGRYLVAEVEGGGFSRDVMEFLVKEDVVAYRCMATKVTFVYPFTTAFGDSKGQEERMKKLIDQLGWYAPTFESME
ncbi:PREDICTED: thylakoid lumenal 17.9 kDa protein, chloroplastic-like [Camelina sativa]|uniref:Thylakoid lumenal 17.9 kDa protein, chloroplastic-like n=1 Tax=Camelina sativa TaxID=90675 RepID=A0ABM0UZB3_CAMSA|nr:PREDICTED: thylakoid lumenal 17.9 kDa protein, chloroplastic-like [Camelina sativa]